jgi:hypothetical protein
MGTVRRTEYFDSMSIGIRTRIIDNSGGKKILVWKWVSLLDFEKPSGNEFFVFFQIIINGHPKLF